LEIEEFHNHYQQALSQIELTTLNLIENLEVNKNWGDLLSKSESMKANEDAQIYKHLNTAFEKILEPDTFRDIRDSQGQKKTLLIGKYVLEVTVVHRAFGIENVHGVDVVYKFDDKKVLAFQHKKRDRKGNLPFSAKDRTQQKKIINLCDYCKLPPRQKKINRSFIRPYCGSLYVIGDSDGGVRHVVSSCQIEEYRGYYRSSTSQPLLDFPSPANLLTIDQMFVSCAIGFQLGVEKDNISSQSIEDAFINQPDIVFRATLSSSGDVRDSE